ncbi:MAG: lipoate--protein ligase [Bacteroidales bacterium]|jgi:lipoate-protein ligase A|nr:lipoate--protein ligase [Bacteroidales bacterium]
MQCIILPSSDPYFNLAADEFLLRNSDDEYFLLSINKRSVITGKHQIPHREADTRFVTVHGIPVIRRISGGGTVFHDSGNLNFSFILNSSEGKQIDFMKYTLPVISFLASLGIEARFEGKNDLKVGGLKISGNAEHIYRNRVLHHGTLLFSADLDFLRKCIRKDTSVYETRAVSSNPSPVTNLDGMLGTVRDTTHFRDLMLEWFLAYQPGSYKSTLSDDETRQIGELAETRYKSWEWTYAYGPPYRLRKVFNYEGKEVLCDLAVQDGIIIQCLLTGHGDLENTGILLKGCRHMVSSVKEILGKENIFRPGFDVFNLF